MFLERIYSESCARRASRRIAYAVTGAALVTLLAASSATAQPDRDSLAIRLRRAEEAIAVLQRNLAEQAEAAVQTRSRIKMDWHGRVSVNGFGNSRRVNNVDNPQFARPDTVPGLPVRGIGMSIRQTRLGFEISAADVLGGQFLGDLDVDFYGGQQPSSGGRTFPLLRLRTARAIARWEHGEIMIGQESPLISDVDPITPAAIGSPAFAGAGNLWLWLPQLRAGAHTSGRFRFGAQAAVLAPTSGDPVAAFDTDYDLAERSQRPYLQARLVAASGEGDMTREVGCGVHVGWLVPVTERVDANAIACDLVLPLSEWIEVRGEFFRGQALRGLGGGGIGQSFTPTNEALKTTGGWTQINVRHGSRLRAGLGCGVDHPEALALRRRNDACAVYTIVRPTGPLFAGAELRRLRTGYSSARFTNDHVTLTAGFEF